MAVDVPDAGENQEQPSDFANADAEALAELRRILFDPYQVQLNELNAQLNDDEALAAIVAPILGEAIRRKIREGRDEMVEALYPILGQLVARAVTEAVRDLARTVDARMRTSYTPQALLRRLRTRLGGGSTEELALRELLPFRVVEVFLIHRATGLLLGHASGDPTAASDSDLISGMLTAIRDFATDAFGRGQEGQLDEIQFGELRILIETAQLAYLAVVVDGVEPAGFRSRLRSVVVDISQTYQEQLRDFAGDTSALAPADEQLAALLQAPSTAPPPAPAQLSATQKRVLAGAAALIVACSALTCLAGSWAWRTARALSITPTPVVLIITATPTVLPTATATATATATPTATASPTATGTPTTTPSPTATWTPSPTPTATALPPQAIVSVLRLLVRSGPGPQYAPMAVALLGQSFTVVSRSADGEWWQVCCLADGAKGWVANTGVVVEGVTAGVPIVPIQTITP